MPDWDRIVGERLPKLRLPESREQEIRDELAGHFAELHADFLTRTHSEEEATRLVLAEIGDWSALARKIRIAEQVGMLNPRVRTLWLPGLMGLAASAFSSIVLSMVLRTIPGGDAAFLKAVNDSGLVMVFFGLSALPTGFVSASIAWCLGASGVRRVCAAILPLVVVWVAGMLVALGMGAPLPVVLGGDHLQIIPYLGAGLMAGGLPFFFRRQRPCVVPNRWAD